METRYKLYNYAIYIKYFSYFISRYLQFFNIHLFLSTIELNHNYINVHQMQYIYVYKFS